MSKHKQTVASAGQDAFSLLKASFMASASSGQANKARKTATSEASAHFLSFARACASLSEYEGYCERFTAYLATAEGQEWAKTLGYALTLTKSGKVKLPSSFANYISHGRRGWQMVETKMIPSLDGITTDSKLRAIISEKQEALAKLDDASRKMTEEERKTREVRRQASAEIRMLLNNIADRAKQLTSERVMLALPLLGDVASKLLELVQLERTVEQELEHQHAQQEALDASADLPTPSLEDVQEVV